MNLVTKATERDYDSLLNIQNYAILYEVPKIIYNKMVGSTQNVKSLSALSPGIGGWNQCYYHLSSMILPYYDE